MKKRKYNRLQQRKYNRLQQSGTLQFTKGAAIVRNLKRMCGFNDYEEIIHHDMIPLAIKESEKDVQTIISILL